MCERKAQVESSAASRDGTMFIDWNEEISVQHSTTPVCDWPEQTIQDMEPRIRKERVVGVGQRRHRLTKEEEEVFMGPWADHQRTGG